MKYAIFRVFLTPRSEQGDLFWNKEGRRDYLIRCFSQQFQFVGRSGTDPFVYKPYNVVGETITGRVGRRRDQQRTLGPEQDFTTVEDPAWQTSDLILDLAGGPDGQKLALRMNDKVANPKSITTYLARSLNEKMTDYQWYMDINPISDSSTFWQAAQRHKGKISEIELEFVTPNMFGSEDEINEALKEIRNRTNARTVTQTYRSEDGNLEPDDEQTRQQVEYIAKGGGVIKMKAKGKGTVYDSRNRAQTKSVEAKDDVTLTDNDDKKKIDRIRKWLFE